jgi:hypothetical protein
MAIAIYGIKQGLPVEWKILKELNIKIQDEYEVF